MNTNHGDFLDVYLNIKFKIKVMFCFENIYNSGIISNITYLGISSVKENFKQNSTQIKYALLLDIP